MHAARTAEGVHLTFSTLCPAVRSRLCQSDEPVTLAHSEGGWRQPLAIWQPDGKAQVLLLPGVPLPWAAFVALRDVLLDLAAEPGALFLLRLTRLAGTTDLALHKRDPAATPPPLTARGFLAFRSFFEARVAAVDPEALGGFIARARALLPELALADGDLSRLSTALHGEWREPLRQWLVPEERSLLEVFEVWLGLRVVSLPFDRDISLARAWAELWAGAAAGIRTAAALGELRQRPLDAPTLTAALALGEHFVAAVAAPLPPFEPARDLHDRGPRLADLDMSLESIC